MESWIISAVAVGISIAGSWGLSQRAAGRRDREIELLQEQVRTLEARAAEQATATALAELSARFDRWGIRIESEIKRMMRGMVKLAAGQPVKIEELLGDE